MRKRLQQMNKIAIILLASVSMLTAPACGQEQPSERKPANVEPTVMNAAQPAVRTARESVPRSPVDPEVEESLRHARALSRAFQHAAQKIDPSVVHIIQQREVRVVRSFFDPGERRLAPTGTGSGFIITPDGYIVTNHHVIAGADRVQVKLNDGREYPGRIIGSDPATDLGVVKIEGENLVAARFGDSDGLEVGEWVLAVGSPFGVFNNTVTAGIVSAKGRRGLVGPADRFEDFIQTDAAINPGNSGGPLVNLEGEVIGINSQIATRTGGSVGIGFAIPSAIGSYVVDSLINTGRVERGWLGVMGPDESQAVAQFARHFEQAGVPQGDGALVTTVVPDGPGARAGLMAGDVIVSFNGRAVQDFARFRNAVAFTPPGTRARLEVMRGGRRVPLEVTVLDHTRGQALMTGGAAFPAFGFTVESLSRDVLRQVGLQSGVRVNQVETLGPAALADLRVGDIIVYLNGNAVASAQAFDQMLREINGQPIRVGVLRPSTRGTGYLDIMPRE